MMPSDTPTADSDFSTRNATQPAPRRHDLDALRAAAMLLGIAYHIALSFAAGLPWMVQDSNQSRGIYLFQAAVHGFRMPLFMLVSGFFTAMLWRKRGLKSLLGHRFRRVLLPCLLGLVTVVPAVNWSISVAMESGSAKRVKAALAEPASASIWAAIRRGDASALQLHLRNAGALNNLHPSFGTTPLTWAALTGQREMAAVLLGQGAEVNERNRDGGTALHAAAFLGHAEIVDLLIRSGADANIQSYAGEVPLGSAAQDYGVVQYIAGILNLPAEKGRVEQGRQTVVKQLRALGAKESATATGAQRPGGERADSGSPWAVVNWLVNAPVFGLLWFLWFLWWLVIVFAVYALVMDWLEWKVRPHWLLLSPARLIWLVPLTMIPIGLMSSGSGEFGPDTSMGIMPMPHVFLYYALFFGFGVFYYDGDDVAGRVGKSWRWTLPITLLIVFPIALEFATGTFGWRDSWLPVRFHRPASVALQSCYAWLMAFGCMGMFRTMLTRENRILRYVSDSSYWLYLTHLPLTILAQDMVRDWPWPAALKLALITGLLTGFLLLIYDKMVRYTWLGTLLNGPKTRPGKQPATKVVAEGSIG